MFVVSTRHFRTAVQAAALTYSFALSLTCMSSSAEPLATPSVQPAIIYYDLPVLPLGQALLEFSLQSGVSVVVQQDKVAGIYSSPIIGCLLYTSDAADE